ncbi:hypothetical protein LCGC14_2362070 [marine sediment metagenome]|uniref:LysM domain-containing protein n=1 Tax=marine sediment metagenome TaxID=412755 RepID=A0A0F9C6L0_9ZZZZ
MSADTYRSLRMIAPALLALFAVVFLVVIVTSLGEGSDSGDSERMTNRTGQRQSSDRSDEVDRERKRRVYTVKTGDNLFTIAEETGTTVGELRALNPSLDPQQLVAGQRVKLRE